MRAFRLEGEFAQAFVTVTPQLPAAAQCRVGNTSNAECGSQRRLEPKWLRIIYVDWVNVVIHVICKPCAMLFASVCFQRT